MEPQVKACNEKYLDLVFAFVFIRGISSQTAHYSHCGISRTDKMKLQRGFTLIELLVVMVIIGVLTMIAMPSYNNYMIRGRIPDATSNLASKRIKMEQFFQDNKTYVGGTGCNLDTTSSQYFSFSCPVAATNTTYSIVATGTGSMAGFSYTIDQTNTRTSAITAPANSSWIANSSSCWITKQGGVC